MGYGPERRKTISLRYFLKLLRATQGPLFLFEDTEVNNDIDHVYSSFVQQIPLTLYAARVCDQHFLFSNFKNTDGKWTVITEDSFPKPIEYNSKWSVQGKEVPLATDWEGLCKTSFGEVSNKELLAYANSPIKKMKIKINIY